MPISLQADYDYLRQLARELGDHADDVHSTLRRLQYHLDVLANGGWLGYAAERFLDEMHNDVVPFLYHFNEELMETGRNIANLVDLFQHIDEHLPTYFQTNATAQATFFPGNTKYSTIKLERAQSSQNLGSWHKVDGLDVTWDTVDHALDADGSYVLTGVEHAATDTNTPHALPEVDDEVLVGFSGGDSASQPAWPVKWHVPPEDSASKPDDTDSSFKFFTPGKEADG